MNIKIIEKALLPLFLATLTVTAFNWQFVHIYPYLIEHFRLEKLSILYSHLFIYTFLILTLFIFFIIVINRYIVKSKVFSIVTIVMLLSFYLFSHNMLEDIFSYFLSYPLSTNAIMGMVLFVVGSISYSLYALVSMFLKNAIPLSHSFIFVILSISYSALFINHYCYSIFEIMDRVK